LPIQINGIERANHNRPEASIVKTQKAGNVRGKGKKDVIWKNKTDPVVISATPFGIWDIIKQFHPNKKEILPVVRVLNRIGAKRTMIAAALGLQEWKNVCGFCEWTEEDVQGLLDEYRA
jgi:hypothetical protein